MVLGPVLPEDTHALLVMPHVEELQRGVDIRGGEDGLQRAQVGPGPGLGTLQRSIVLTLNSVEQILELCAVIAHLHVPQFTFLSGSQTVRR